MLPIDYVKCSFDQDISHLNKSETTKLIDDDYFGKDTLHSSLKIKSKIDGTYFKMNNALKFETNDGDLKASLVQDWEAVLRQWSSWIKMKTKNGRWSSQRDFGKLKVEVPCRGKTHNIFLNPYWKFGATTSMSNWVFSLGGVAHWWDQAWSRIQLNHDSRDAVDEKSAFSLKCREDFKYGKFWSSCLYNTNVKSLFRPDVFDVRMGWNEGSWGLMTQFNRLLADYTYPFCDSVTLGGYYKNDKIGTTGFKAKKCFDGRPVHVEAAIKRNVNDKLTVKAKVDNSFNWNLFSNYRICSHYNIQFSLMGNLQDSDKVNGLYELPIKFGFKGKMLK